MKPVSIFSWRLSLLDFDSARWALAQTCFLKFQALGTCLSHPGSGPGTMQWELVHFPLSTSPTSCIFLQMRKAMLHGSDWILEGCRDIVSMEAEPLSVVSGLMSAWFLVLLGTEGQAKPCLLIDCGQVEWGFGDRWGYFLTLSTCFVLTALLSSCLVHLRECKQKLAMFLLSFLLAEVFFSCRVRSSLRIIQS